MDRNGDQLSIETPELVAIEMPLAGIGSRFIAVLIDTLIWVLAMAVLSVLFWLVRPGIGAFSRLSAQWAVAVYVLVFFLLNWGYFTLFEAFWGGRTPGKRIAGIRVIQRSGRAIGLLESMARNFIRYIDQIPFFYAVGMIAMFATKQHQRLGDLAAGTLVVRDRAEEAPLESEMGLRTFTAPLFHAESPQEAPLPFLLDAAGLARLSAGDLEVLESFLARRLDLPPEAREKLAQRIAEAVRAKSGLETPADTDEETFLEVVARQYRDTAGLQERSGQRWI